MASHAPRVLDRPTKPAPARLTEGGSQGFAAGKALVEAAVHAHRTTAPDLALYRATRERARSGAVVRCKIGKRAFHALRELELHAA